MDFDLASKAWLENKIKINGGAYIYKCKLCNRQRLYYSKKNKNFLEVCSPFCKKHILSNNSSFSKN
jgi:hypothetical protein